MSYIAAAPPRSHDAPERGEGGRVHYRAIHTKTSWRRVDNHASLDNAIYGKDGAAGLFAGRVRINRELHGEPQFVIAWREGDHLGKVIRAHPEQPSQVEVVNIPIDRVERMEEQGGASTSELMKYFT